MVVLENFLDTGRGNNHSVDSPDATVFEVGLWEKRTVWGEEFCSGDRVGFVVVEPGVLGTVGDHGTGEWEGIGGARGRRPQCSRCRGCAGARVARPGLKIHNTVCNTQFRTEHQDLIF